MDWFWSVSRLEEYGIPFPLGSADGNTYRMSLCDTHGRWIEDYEIQRWRDGFNCDDCQVCVHLWVGYSVNQVWYFQLRPNKI